MGVDPLHDLAGQRTQIEDVCDGLWSGIDTEVRRREVPVRLRGGVGQDTEHMVRAVRVVLILQPGVIDWAGMPLGVMVSTPDTEGCVERAIEIGERRFGHELREDLGHGVNQVGPQPRGAGTTGSHRGFVVETFDECTVGCVHDEVVVARAVADIEPVHPLGRQAGIQHRDSAAPGPQAFAIRQYRADVDGCHVDCRTCTPLASSLIAPLSASDR